MTTPVLTTDNNDGTQTVAWFEKATSTWTFLVIESSTNKALIIDSVLDYDPITGAITTKHADALLSYIQEHKIGVEKILETHCHADHITAAQYLKGKLGGDVPVCIGKGILQVQEVVKKKYGLGDEFKTDGTQFDALFENNDTFTLGKNTTVRVIHTPGHTPDSNSFLIGQQIYVGDVIFQPDVGSARCDFPGGSAQQLFESIRDKVLALPEGTRVYVGHDYPPADRTTGPEPIAFTTVATQKAGNKHVNDGVDLQSFKAWREQRDATLGQPRLLHASLQSNTIAGHLPPALNGVRAFRTPIQGIPSHM